MSHYGVNPKDALYWNPSSPLHSPQEAPMEHEAERKTRAAGQDATNTLTLQAASAAERERVRARGFDVRGQLLKTQAAGELTGADEEDGDVTPGVKRRSASRMLLG